MTTYCYKWSWLTAAELPQHMLQKKIEGICSTSLHMSTNYTGIEIIVERGQQYICMNAELVYFTIDTKHPICRMYCEIDYNDCAGSEMTLCPYNWTCLCVN